MLVVQSLLLSIGMDAFGRLKTIVQRYLYNRFQGEKIMNLNSQNLCVSIVDEFGLRFLPPVYIQRYMIVQEILENPIWNGSIKKVVDFGCSELGMFTCIKLVPGLNNIMLVDIDYDTLYKNQTKVEPTNNNHFSVSDCKEPLTVDLYHGSIADLDDRMLGVDAVLCVELIQHLYSDDLDVVPCTVFDFIKPKLAVFTTPNKEFNILFPNFSSEFRHNNHKFEWTRKQFENWAKKIIVQYPEYAVQFDGIGVGPSGTTILGCSNQIAIFYRKDMKTSPVNPIGSMPYKLMRRVVYPFNEHGDNTITERIIYDRLRTFITETLLNKEYLVGDKIEIPLNKVMPYVSDCCTSIDELENFVGKLYHTKKNTDGEWLLIISESEYSLDDDKSFTQYSLSNCSGQEYRIFENKENDDNEDCGTPVDLYLGKTPTNHKVYSNDMDSFNSVNSDLVKTTVDYDKSENLDMDISSSSNSTIIVDDCKVYEDFVIGRKNSNIHEEDINKTGKSLTNIMNNQLNNDTNIENSIISSLTSNCQTDTVN